MEIVWKPLPFRTEILMHAAVDAKTQLNTVLKTLSDSENDSVEAAFIPATYRLLSYRKLRFQKPLQNEFVSTEICSVKFYRRYHRSFIVKIRSLKPSRNAKELYAILEARLQTKAA